MTRGRTPTASRIAALALLAVTVGAGAARADAPVEARVEVRVGEGLERLEGEVALTVRNATSGRLDHVDLWLFPNALREPPEAMNEVREPRTFPSGFEPAGMSLGAVRDAAGRRLEVERPEPTRARVRLAEPVDQGASVRLEVAFETRVPHRYGPFGHAVDQLTLDGGFFPRPPPMGDEGFRADLPPARIDWRLSVRWARAEEARVIASGDVARLEPSGSASLGPGRAERVSFVLMPVSYHSHLSTDDTKVLFLHRRERHFDWIRGRLVDFGFVDVHAQSLATAGAAVDFYVDRTGVEAPGHVLLVEAPLRRDIAIGGSGVVLVSDRAFEVTPTERFRKIHRVALARSLYDTLLRDRVERTSVRRRDRVRDLFAVELAGGWETMRYGRSETVSDVVSEAGTSLNAIDDTLHTGHLPFPRAYFRDVDDTDPYRDRFVLFSHRFPTGRLWQQKLHDRLGREVMRQLTHAVVAEERTFLEALERHAPEVGLDWLRQWDHGAPPVNYALEAVEPAPERGPDAVDVTVSREGTTDLDEPLEVRVGKQLEQFRFEPGTEARLETSTERDAPRVEVDPRGHVEESDLGRPVDPVWDNRNFHPWRPLLEGLSLSFSSATGRLDTTATGFLKRDDDLRNRIALELFDRERRLVVGSTWLRGFGEKVRPNRLRYAFGIGLDATWLKPVEGRPSGGGAKLTFLLRDWNYLSRTDPRSGWWRELRIGPSFQYRGGHGGLDVRDGLRPDMTVHDLLQDRGSEGAAVSGFLRGLVTRLFNPSANHVLALRGDAATWVGSVPLGERWALGGPDGVRAFSAFESDGRHRVLTSMEWRHRLGNGLSVNLGHVGWIERIDGVLFADAALLGSRIDDMAEPASTFLGVGYGLRVHYLMTGVHPFLLRLDVAYPVIERGELAEGDPGRISVVFGVEQSF